MVRSLLHLVTLLTLTFHATALRPTEMEMDEHSLKPEAEAAVESNASSLSQLHTVDPVRFHDVLFSFMFNMAQTVGTGEGAVNPTDPIDMPVSIFHSAARQALWRLYTALCENLPTSKSVLRAMKEEDPTLASLTAGEKKVIQALIAMKYRMEYTFNMFYGPFIALGMNLESDGTSTKSKEKIRDTMIAKLQAGVESFVNLFKMGTPEEMDQGFVVPIYVLWKYKAAWDSLQEKVNALGIKYYDSSEYSLTTDFAYICTVISVSTPSRERLDDGSLPEPVRTPHPSPFVKFAQYCLEKIWPEADLKEPFPSASFAVTGTSPVQEWDTTNDGPWEKGENGYGFQML
mmetsp:Transcript_68085/g.127143  ORF Transcript_68085/g.127143 Transcript_68085/m.127143 type:complete len:345 (-) Transcript_68085:55-1089(-)